MDALLGHLFGGISPAALAWYQDWTGISQKLHRLDMLVTKIRSVVEVSEKAEIKSESLRRWQQKLKDAATQGDEVLRKLQGQVNSSSSSSPSGICVFFERVFSRMEEVDKLNSTIEWLEQSSVNVKDFLKTLKLELSDLVEQRSKKKRRRRRRRSRHPVIWETIPIASKKVMAVSQLPADHLDTDSEESEELEEKRNDENLVLEDTNTKDSSEEMGQPVSPDPLHLLPSRNVEEVTAVEGLAARIQHAIDRAKLKDEDGSSWFGQWIDKLREAVSEGNSVASAIKSSNYLVDDRILDEVVAIVAAVRLRLESMVHDLEDFSNLAEVEKLARELTPAVSSNAAAHRK